MPTSYNLKRYNEIYERTLRNAGNPNKERSLAGWRERAGITRMAIRYAKAEHDKQVKEAQERYSNAVFGEKLAEYDADYSIMLDIAKKRVTDDLEDILEGKRQQYDKSMGAPSEEHLRLLQALNMRSNLTLSEIAAVSNKFDSNLQALGVLRDIAQRHGVSFPAMTDPDTFEEQLASAEQFAKDKLNTLDADLDDMGYKDRLFWDKPGDGEDSYFFGILDGAGFTTEQLEFATAKAKSEQAPSEDNHTTATASGADQEMWAKVRLNGNQSISTIANQFHTTISDIIDANNGRDLSRTRAGDEIYVPSTRFSFQPDPSGGHVQPGDVVPVPRPVAHVPTGPSGEEPGDDIIII